MKPEAFDAMVKYRVANRALEAVARLGGPPSILADVITDLSRLAQAHWEDACRQDPDLRNPGIISIPDGVESRVVEALK